MAMVTLRTEPQCFVHGFQGGAGMWAGRGFTISNLGHQDAMAGFVDLGLSKSMRLDQVMKKTSDLPFGGTDCSLPMRYALRNRIPVDVFVTLTDSETWAGEV